MMTNTENYQNFANKSRKIINLISTAFVRYSIIQL